MVQDSSACYSSRSQPSPFTHADSTHYDDDNAADERAPLNQACPPPSTISDQLLYCTCLTCAISLQLCDVQVIVST